jgi:hypothetical protein
MDLWWALETVTWTWNSTKVLYWIHTWGYGCPFTQTGFPFSAFSSSFPALSSLLRDSKPKFITVFCLLLLHRLKTNPNRPSRPNENPRSSPRQNPLDQVSDIVDPLLIDDIWLEPEVCRPVSGVLSFNRLQYECCGNGLTGWLRLVGNAIVWLEIWFHSIPGHRYRSWLQDVRPCQFWSPYRVHGDPWRSMKGWVAWLLMLLLGYVVHILRLQCLLPPGCHLEFLVCSWRPLGNGRYTRLKLARTGSKVALSP